MIDGPEVTIVHDFAETYGGAERIVAEIARVFPGARFVAIAGRRQVAERIGVADRFESLLGEGELLLGNHRKLTPLFPLLAATRRLGPTGGLDLLVSSSYAFAHGFRGRGDPPHLSYCYSPLRAAWTMPSEYGSQLAGSRLGPSLGRAAARPLRSADRRFARRVDRYLAESEYVRAQIRSFWGRGSTVVHPPVDCELFSPGSSAAAGPDSYTLLCGRLIEPYKRPTIAVEAFSRMPDRRLVVAGDGPELDRLRRIATPNVEFTGALGDADLVELMRGCSFALFPSRDDFGLIPVEVAACGRPALAYGAGGALETIVPGVTGELFGDQSVAGIVAAVERFTPDAYDPVAVREHALRWDAPRFRQSIADSAMELLGV